ncbi:MAG: 1,4-dihydroxy-6-naphthoate synthase [bacterium]|nr:1,4-dihydroxy-6-naphthoate synthase [bacterium]MDT8396269.1 1,4-dihydroxy-6-naphthoate synthase [bacterium]
MEISEQYSETRRLLTLGFSPCPNDTFIFHGIASGKLTMPGYEFTSELHDVETLNQMAAEGTLDITKLSFHAWLRVKPRYRMLASGGALGYGCGPVVMARSQLTRVDIAHCRVVLPGDWTTAHLLFRLWAPEAEDRYFLPYDHIFRAVASGEADCGVIIHENRFTFEQAGFHAIVDLGAWWERETNLPIPLGCIAARRSLSAETTCAIEDLIRRSIRMAIDDPESVFPYVRQHAQEMDDPVIARHIRTFVNDLSLDLGENGHAAVAALEKKALMAGVLG